MRESIIKNLLIIVLVLPISCGFKAIDKSQFNNFSIKNINSDGDKRINFKIKNDLMIQSDNKDKTVLLMNLYSEKIKTIKEKNIKNEITKYQILIKSEIIFNIVGELKKYKINTSRTGDYIVADNYSTTLSNEKKLISDLVEDVSENILDEINLIINDL